MKGGVPDLHGLGHEGKGGVPDLHGLGHEVQPAAVHFLQAGLQALSVGRAPHGGQQLVARHRQRVVHPLLGLHLGLQVLQHATARVNSRHGKG